MIKLVTSAGLLLCILSSAPMATAVEPGDDVADARAHRQSVDRAIRYLQTHGQATDGSYSAQAGPGVTAVITAGILRNGRTAADPLVAKSLKYLQRFVQPDGGIYNPKMQFRNYETCLAILCFTEANSDGRYDKLIKNAQGYIKEIQWDEGEGHDPSSTSYGGSGYGKHQRPDLSNTQFFVDAMKASGAGPEDEALKRALAFVSRCQNLETEHNTTEHAAKNPDGGFYYTCAAGGSSQAGETPQGGLRSYGSMTYAGLKSMLYAGVEPDDPRVKAALKWIEKHYGLDANPGMADNGLYYYYHVFAKSLDATGLDEIEDADGVKHDWRADLRAELTSRQRPDGSWVNENSRWLEGDSSLVTGYALLALSYCRP